MVFGVGMWIGVRVDLCSDVSVLLLDGAYAGLNLVHLRLADQRPCDGHSNAHRAQGSAHTSVWAGGAARWW